MRAAAHAPKPARQRRRAGRQCQPRKAASRRGTARHKHWLRPLLVHGRPELLRTQSTPPAKGQHGATRHARGRGCAARMRSAEASTRSSEPPTKTAARAPACPTQRCAGSRRSASRRAAAAPGVRRGPVCGAGGAGAPRHAAEARLRAGARPKCPQQARRAPPAARAAPGRGAAPFWPARGDLAPRRAAPARRESRPVGRGRGRPGCRDKMTSPTCRTGEGPITTHGARRRAGASSAQAVPSTSPELSKGQRVSSV